MAAHPDFIGRGHGLGINYRRQERGDDDQAEAKASHRPNENQRLLCYCIMA